jgi:hypothetical protein
MPSISLDHVQRAAALGLDLQPHLFGVRHDVLVKAMYQRGSGAPARAGAPFVLFVVLAPLWFRHFDQALARRRFNA